MSQDLNPLIVERMEAFAASIGAEPSPSGWHLDVAGDQVEIHGGFRRGQWTYLGETGDDLTALYALAKGAMYREARAQVGAWLAEQGADVFHEEPTPVREADMGNPITEPEPAPKPRPAPTHGQNGRTGDLQKLLPQSMEAEMALLGSFLIDPERVGDLCSNRRVTARHFHNPAHAALFEELMLLWGERMPIDLVTLTEHLRGAKLLDKCGGPAALGDLFTHMPTAANAEHYLEILAEKWTRRRVIDLCTRMADRCHDQTGEATELLDEAETRLAEIAEARYQVGIERVEFLDLVDFDRKNDPDEVLGNRWLCKGGSALWVGQSGIGKSSLCMQSAMYWGMGQKLWGIGPSKGRRLKSLIIQAENDRGDMAEMAQGVLAGFPPEQREALIDTWKTQLIFHRVTVQTGPEFTRLCDRLIRAYKPDLVWIDPLLSYVGGDLSKQEVASHFLRNLLNPIAFETGIIWMMLHHTGKPPQDPKAKSGWTETDFAYQAFGSSELINWARAVNVLQSGGNGTFELRLAKRGKRAGALTLPNEAGEQTFTDLLYLRHGQSGIYWEQQAQMTEEEREASRPQPRNGRGTFGAKHNAKEILDRLQTHSGIRPGELRKAVDEATGMTKATFYRMIGTLKIEKKIIEKKGEYFLAPKS